MKDFDPFAGWLRWIVLWLSLIGLGLILLGYGIAKAQHNHTQHHDWYRSLQTPQGYSCCNGTVDGKEGDCRPVRAEARDGEWWAYFGGRWQPVPPSRILPDRLNRVPLYAHICEQDGYVRCFLRGGGGT